MEKDSRIDKYLLKVRFCSTRICVYAFSVVHDLDCCDRLVSSSGLRNAETYVSDVSSKLEHVLIQVSAWDDSVCTHDRDLVRRQGYRSQHVHLGTNSLNKLANTILQRHGGFVELQGSD